jgi:regulator of protease activity HflC (stomatin/prohibitin superfamily)
MVTGLFVLAFFGTLLVAVLLRAFRVVPDSQRLVVYRLGRPLAVRGPGLVLLFPLLDRAVAVDMRSQSTDLALDGVELRGGTEVSMKLTVRHRVSDAMRALQEVADYRAALRQLGATVLRHACRELEPAALIDGRGRLEEELCRSLQASAAGWGVEIERVELPPLDRFGRPAAR